MGEVCKNPNCDTYVIPTITKRKVGNSNRKGDFWQVNPRKYCSNRCKRNHYYTDHRILEIVDAQRWQANNMERTAETRARYSSRQKKEMMI